LLSDTVSTRSYVRLLKHLGIALIFAPEPFTTPFGVACILAARHLSKRHEVNVNNRLRETVRYCLAHSNRSGERVDAESGVPAQVKCPGLCKGLPILGEITGGRSFEAKPSIREGRQGVRENTSGHSTDMQGPSPHYTYGGGLSDASTGTQKVIRHTIDMGWLSHRYEAASAVAHSGWTTTCGVMEGVTHHSVNMGILSQRYVTGSVGQAKQKPHTRNTAPLRQRYGATGSQAMVHNALQNNNRYYDMSSRKNVIGGF
jgi:hypothetical protein